MGQAVPLANGSYDWEVPSHLSPNPLPLGSWHRHGAALQVFEGCGPYLPFFVPEAAPAPHSFGLGSPCPPCPLTSILCPRLGPPVSPTWRQSKVLPVQLPLASSDPFLPHGAEAAPPGPRQASQGGQPAPSRATGPCRVGKVGLRPRSDVGEGEAGSCLGHPRPRVGLGTLVLSQPRKEASPGKVTLEALPGKLRGSARQLPGFELPLGWGRGTDRDWLLSDQAWPSPPSPTRKGANLAGPPRGLLFLAPEIPGWHQTLTSSGSLGWPQPRRRCAACSSASL